MEMFQALSAESGSKTTLWRFTKIDIDYRKPRF